jgi:hypothetical protein
MRLRLIFILSLSFLSSAFAQDSVIHISGFADLYYAYDFNKPIDRNRSFTTQPLRHNEFNLNWGFIKADYLHERVRSSFALQTGTYVQVNYAYEPDLLRLIYLANIGYKLSEKIWIDAGIMPSHIGSESAISMENFNYSRNIASDYSPYYQCGIHLSVDFSPKLSAKVALLNGFQIIKENNNAKSLGVLLSYRPNGKIEIAYNNYLGNEAPSDSIVINDVMSKLDQKYRFLNDVYVKMKLTEKFSLVLAGEYNWQEKFENKETGKWFTGVVNGQYQVTRKFAIAGRFEIYSDKNQIMVVTGSPEGFQVRSTTITLNYFPEQNLCLRLEGRSFISKDAIYPTENNLLVKDNSFISLSAAVKF